MQSDVRITCPKCNNVFALDETLAGPIVEKARADMQVQVDAERQRADDAKAALTRERALIETVKANLETEVTQKLAEKRPEFEANIRKAVVAEMAADVKAKEQENESLRRSLTDAQQAQLAAMRAQQEAERKAASVDLEVAKKVTAETNAIREEAAKDAREAEKLNQAQLQKKLDDALQQVETMKRRIEQGSQQLQGEVAERDLEDVLAEAFRYDTIEPIKTGVRGADVMQRVIPSQGMVSGVILWERKRAQGWGGDWTSKARKDAAEAKAEVVVIVSDVLPKEVLDLGPFDGIWVAKPGFAVQLAHVLRHGLIEAAAARKTAEGKQTKAGMLYDYMAGPDFAARLKGIAEPFVQMQKDLDSEIRTMTQRWSKRKKQIDMVLSAAYGMRGDIEAVTGADLPELEQVELKALGAPDDEETGANEQA